MAKFVVAFSDRPTGEKIAGMLRENGYEVLRVCVSGDEIRRAFRMIQDGILVSGYQFRDQRLDQIAEDLNEHIEILCISTAANTAKIESRRIFRTSGPVTRALLAAWCDMLTQLHYQNLPKKESDTDVIIQAKQQIMHDMKLSESEAHRYMQRISMRLGLRMSQVAERIINKQNV